MSLNNKTSLSSLSRSKDVATQKHEHVSFSLKEDYETTGTDNDNYNVKPLSTSNTFINSESHDELLENLRAIHNKSYRNSFILEIRCLLSALKDVEENKNVLICSHCSKLNAFCKNCQRCAQIVNRFLATKGYPDWLKRAKTLITNAVYDYNSKAYVKDISNTELMHILKELQKVIKEEKIQSKEQTESYSLDRRLLEKILNLVKKEYLVSFNFTGSNIDDDTLGEEFIENIIYNLRPLTKEKLLPIFGPSLCEEINNLLLKNLKLSKEDLEQVLGVDLVTYMIDSILGHNGKLDREKVDIIFGNRLSSQLIDRALSYYQGIVDFKDKIVKVVSRYVSEIAMPQIMSELQDNKLRKQTLDAIVPPRIVNNIINGALMHIGILTKHKLERLTGQTLSAELENKLLSSITPLTHEKSKRLFGFAKTIDIEDKVLTYAGENLSNEQFITILGRNQVTKLRNEILRNLKTKKITESKLVKLLGQDFDEDMKNIIDSTNPKSNLRSQKADVKLKLIRSHSPKAKVLSIKQVYVKEKTKISPNQDIIFHDKIDSSKKTVCNLKTKRALSYPRKDVPSSRTFVGKENKQNALKVSQQANKEGALLPTIAPIIESPSKDIKKSFDLPNIAPHRRRKNTYLMLNRNFDSKTAVGVLSYQLSDPKFIENGWTQLPTLKEWWRLDTYKTEQVTPEHDWFKRHKNKGVIFYNSGERLAEIDDDCYGRWYYKNGNIALDYYKAKEPLIGSRYVIYSSGQKCEFGPKMEPITLLASFDLLGNGIVFDEFGNERLKYNQREGISYNKLTRTSWFWHNLARVMPEIVFTEQYDPIDQSLLKQLVECQDTETLENEAEQQMLEIELKDQARENMRKIKKFKVFEIQPKYVKINKQFSLNILSQKTIYLKFKDENGITLKQNVGVKLIHEDVIHSEIIPNKEITTSFSAKDPESESIKDLKYLLKTTRARYDKN